MLQVFHSNQVERLIEQLIAQLEAQRQISRFGMFETIHIIVPESRLEEYLKMEIARCTGVCANLVVQTFEDFWASRLQEDEQRLVDEPLMRALLLEALLDHEWLASDQDLVPVRRYLGDARQGVELEEGAEALAQLEQNQRRALQLAQQLATLFVEYTRSRSGVLEGWLGEELYYQETSAAPIELWQRALWRKLFDPVTGLRQELSTQTRRLRLWHELPELLSQGKVSVPKIVHFFGLSSLGPTAYHLLSACAQRVVVFGYSLNPTAHYWEDMRFGRQLDDSAELVFSSASVEHGALDYEGDDSFWSEDANSPHLLRLWGFCGAQHLRALSQLPQLDSVDLYVDPEPTSAEAPPSLLHMIQSDLLHMRRSLRPLPLHDEQVRVLASPSIKREVEVVASEIWRVIERNREAHDRDPSVPLMRFSDIAVLLPAKERDLYQTHIRAVFPTTHELPFNMIDVTALSSSRALEAVQLLLTLPFGQFKRQELLRLLTHPNVIGRFPNLDPQDWLRWCDELKILHGADRHDHADTYIESELFHWDQGLKRLALGAFMTGKRARDKRIFHLGRRQYLPCEQHGLATQESAARLVLMARSLIEDARFCREAKMSLGQWSRFFCRMTTAYLAAVEPEDEFNLQRCRLQFAQLEAQDLTGRPVSYRLACELALDTLRELELRQGQFLLDGVVVAGLTPQRVIPFKVIFALGLGEGLYPENETRRPEDLRFVTDREGQEIAPYATMPDVMLRDLQRYTMLELVLSSREALYLSYVNRDMRDGEEREPSTVINELLYAVAEDFPADGDPTGMLALSSLVVHHELRRFHERYFPKILVQEAAGQALSPLTPSMQPEAVREAHILALRHDLETLTDTARCTYPSLEVLRQAMPESRWRALRRGLGLLEAPGEAPQLLDERQSVLRLSTHDLRGFLECPLQGSAKFLLRLGEDEDEDILLEESELFETSLRARSILLHDVFWEKLVRQQRERTEQDFGQLYDARARYWELVGQVPTGPFYRAARQRHLRTLETWADNMTKLGLEALPRVEVRRFGRQAEHEFIDIAQEPLTMKVPAPKWPGGELHVEIYGRTESLLPDRNAAIITNPTERVWSLSRKYFMRGFLDHVLLAARGESKSEPWGVYINPGEEVQNYKLKNCVRKFKPVDQAQAQGYLGNVISDMLSQVHAYYMPIEVVFEHRERDEPLELVAERKRRNRWATTSADFGPVREAQRFEPPDNALEIIERRYGLYFDRLIK